MTESSNPFVQATVENFRRTPAVLRPKLLAMLAQEVNGGVTEIETVPRNEFESGWVWDKLNELSALPDNWDGYGSPGIQPSVKETASDLIDALHKAGAPRPHLAPVSGGGIQFEWRKKGREMELEILPNGDICFLKVYESGEMQEGTLPRTFHDNVSVLIEWFNA